MAGVPHIAGMMLAELSGKLEGGKPLLSRTVGCWVPESEIADILRETEHDHAGCQIGSYPFFRDGRVGANFVLRSTEADALDACTEDLVARLAEWVTWRSTAASDRGCSHRQPRSRLDRVGVDHERRRRPAWSRPTAHPLPRDAQRELIVGADLGRSSGTAEGGSDAMPAAVPASG
jgi:hypothetical protein